jgi:uncharacterized repeat protein (TIGR04076 family)
MAGLYDMHDVVIKIVSQKGNCEHNHKIGDEWTIDNGKTPAGICMGAFATLIQDIRVLRVGGTFPWSTDPNVTQVACCDAENPVVFELRRLSN